LAGYKGKVKYAQFLHDNSELKFKKESNDSDDLVLELPEKKPGFEIPVIELILE
jgi:alpha-L-fucosidase